MKGIPSRHPGNVKTPLDDFRWQGYAWGVIDWKGFLRSDPLEIQVLPEIARDEILVG